MSPRRVTPERRLAIEQVVQRIRQAIEREPLLRRLPSQAELARLCRVSLREVRSALGRLEADGWIRATRGGYRVQHRPARRVGIQQVVLVHDTTMRGAFCQYVAMGADHRCRQLKLAMQSRWVDPDRVTDQLEELAGFLSGEHIGWLMLAYPPGVLLERWMSAGRRVVMLDNAHFEVAAPAVVPNHVEAARLAVEHLLTLGHRRIATIGTRLSTPGRFLGSVVANILRHEGLEGDQGWNLSYEPEPPRDRVESRLIDWVRRWREASDRPTAIIVHNIPTAESFVRVCRQAGVAVPEQLSVMALGCRFGTPQSLSRLTLANAGTAERIGLEGVDLLIRLDQFSVSPAIKLAAAIENPAMSVSSPG
ncbi:MAG: hypothetical protein BIFFINMI_00519 [Phycisphaerae bacterium]|nr:hypothetical protein [Phycisphaerae bacterium]